MPMDSTVVNFSANVEQSVASHPSPNLDSGILGLPAETTDAVVDRLAEDDDRDSLKALTLTHSRFTIRARQHLHREVYLVPSLPVDYPSVFGAIGHYVNNISIEAGLFLDRPLAHYFPRLRAIKIELTQILSESFQKLFVPQDKHVHTLQLSYVAFDDFDRLINLVSRFQNLRKLHISNTTIDSNLSPKLDDEYMMSCGTLQHLHLSGPWDEFTTYFVDWMSHVTNREGGAQLRTVQIPYPTIDDPTPFRNFAKAISETLTHLRIDYNHRDMGMHADPVHIDDDLCLSELSKLECLTLTNIPIPTSSPPHVFDTPSMDWMAEVLADVDTTSLREVHFHCHIAATNDMNRFPFREVRAILRGRSFPRLESIVFHIPARSPLSDICPPKGFTNWATDIITDSTVVGFRNIVQVVLSEEAVHAEAYKMLRYLRACFLNPWGFIHRDLSNMSSNLTFDLGSGQLVQ
ncbi:hypothetical protein QCA50_005815 [Cerrena zonata]|uniref:F-box domain-containing protein n=1 Tax=Cerrena zonata TaxID=2478898 RepID=A0AAW0GCR2_9APHY